LLYKYDNWGQLGVIVNMLKHELVDGFRNPPTSLIKPTLYPTRTIGIFPIFQRQAVSIDSSNVAWSRDQYSFEKVYEERPGDESECLGGVGNMMRNTYIIIYI
jgi:hypothetical protein